MDNEFSDIFDDDGELAIPTMRGEANLDVQDYQGYDGSSSILDDELQEDVPSTPGRHPGAASATDIEGTYDFDMLEVEGGMDAPGMKQTTFGASPWGPGSRSGYRPYSQQRTGMDLRALGDIEEEQLPAPKPAERDSMHDEPEVINAVPVESPVPWDQEWHGAQNQEPSNAQIDPMTLYDRTSYEYEDSSQDTIGNGIFAMEEGATWRPRDGMFAHQFALPAYIGDEDELGVQQSEMWDSTAGEWRVTQPSASGVAIARRVDKMKKAYSPFASDQPPVQMRPEVTGPRSHIEAFGRKAARCLVLEAQAHRPENRGKFLKAALDALGPQGAARAKAAADKLIQMGYQQNVALEDAAAHLIMHAATKDLTDKRRARRPSLLPRLDAMSRTVVRKAGDLRRAGGDHIAPLTQNGNTLRQDLGALYHSPAGRGMGEVAEQEAAPSSNGNGAPAANGNGGGLFTTKNMLIGAGVGLGAYLLFSNRKSIAKNVKKWMK